MDKDTAVSCACGWAVDGNEEEAIDAFVQHVEEGHGKQIPRADAAAHVTRENR